MGGGGGAVRTTLHSFSRVASRLQAARVFRDAGLQWADEPHDGALPPGRPRARRREERPDQGLPNLTTNTYTVVADLRTKVHNFWDRGLLGLAIDPNFTTNNYIYVLYSYDAPIGGTPPRWGVAGQTSDGCPTPPGATTDGCVISGRLSRLTAVGSDWTASEQVLINDWCQQFPSHSIGALDFGADGYLYVSGGDGASFDNTDWGQFGGTAGSPTPARTPAAIRRCPSAATRLPRRPRAARCAPRARGARRASRGS